jgi:hypothetical protein
MIFPPKRRRAPGNAVRPDRKTFCRRARRRDATCVRSGPGIRAQNGLKNSPGADRRAAGSPAEGCARGIGRTLPHFANHCSIRLIILVFCSKQSVPPVVRTQRSDSKTVKPLARLMAISYARSQRGGEIPHDQVVPWQRRCCVLRRCHGSRRRDPLIARMR